jgi:hypothetical protein
MLALSASSRSRRHRAVTLIEAVLYISVALALIVGGLVFYEQASNAARTSKMLRQLSAVLAEGRVLVRALPPDSIPDDPHDVRRIDVTPTLIAAGAMPSDMVTSPTSLSNPFGGETHFVSYFAPPFGRFFTIFLSDVPQGVCARLLTSKSASGEDYVIGPVGGTTLVGSGYIWGGAGPSLDSSLIVKGYAMNQTQAGWMCKYGGADYADKTVEPTSAPLSGNVAVAMVFMVDG